MLFIVKVILNFVLRLVIVIIFGIILTVTLYIVIGANYKHRQCVQLKNGLNLGYRAVFDFRGTLFISKVVPKFPDGTPLIESDIWPVYVSPTTLYGVAGRETGNFAWRKDTGLVRRRDNPDLHEKLVAEAGDVNPGIKIDIVGTQIILREFKKRPEYADQWCRTRLFAW